MTDFIIVGGGTAGCVLANRLSADRTAQVMLLEAGGRDSNILYRMPGGTLGLMKLGMGNWSYETVAQPGLDGRKMYFPRGKVLGGSSSINGMIFVRGSRADFDQWARVAGDSWSYDQCLPYFKKLEAFAEGPNAYRGGSGPVGISVAPPPDQMSPIGQAVLAAAQQAGYAYNADVNGADQEGFGRANWTIARGYRQSASSAYLAPVRNRPNLRVITGAHATRILLNRGRAFGVEYLHAGRLCKLNTSGEVILACGAINSPHLLQLSGIGPSALLKANGIPVVNDLAGVGENLCDHLVVSVKQEITKPYSMLSHLRPLNIAKALAQYLWSRSGPVASTGAQLVAFLKTRSGEMHPDIQLHITDLLYEDHGRRTIQREGFTITANSSHPRSRGHVTTASADPLQAPLINPNYLFEPDDLRVLRAAVRMSRELIEQPAFNDLRGPEYEPGVDIKTDSELDAFIRRTALTLYHPVGTCRMGSDPLAVVDEHLRVHGAPGLRVVDASVMPTIVSGNTNAATMMIAERAADLIISNTDGQRHAGTIPEHRHVS